MLRYIFTLATLLDSKSRIKKHYSPDVVISDLFDEDLDEIDFINSLSELELIYGFEIPEELYDRTDMTLEQFAYELSLLPVINDELYPEFFDIKFTSMKLTKRWIELEEKTDDESLHEMQRINEKLSELDVQINVLIKKNLEKRVFDSPHFSHYFDLSVRPYVNLFLYLMMLRCYRSLS